VHYYGSHVDHCSRCDAEILAPTYGTDEGYPRVLCTGCGFMLSKYDLFSAVAARGAGQVLLVCSLFLAIGCAKLHLKECHDTISHVLKDGPSVHAAKHRSARC
jgi:hypothetical protein